ncbi:MAG: ABC transporter permease [Bacteroidetes bacterium]|nr:ABC transporter permease [Bacteroidota bacterium]
MIKRSFLKDKKFLFNNILGLALAFTTILFIYSWISYEKSFDKQYENSSQIYRFTVEFANGSNNMHFARTNRSFIKEFTGFFPEVEEMVRLAPGRNSSIKINENRFYSQGVFSTDSNFFDVFNVELIQGNSDEVLDAPKCAVINQSIAKKYFGNENPIGKQLEWAHQQVSDFRTFTVTGVMPDFPLNSHFHPEILLSFDDPNVYTGWFYTYLMLKKNTHPQSVSSKFASFKETYIENKQSRKNEIFHLQSVQDIHLHSQKDREIEPNGDARSITILNIVALILLVVIALNYINFQIASVLERSTYFNISKTFGAKSNSFVIQLALESLILVLISSFISLGVYFLGLPLLANWLNIEMILSPKTTLFVYFLALLFFVLIGVACSIYPVFLSKINGTINSLKVFRSGKSTTTDFSVRRVLVILQFVGGIALTIATTVIIKQNQYLLSNRIGNGQENIINLIKLPRVAINNYKVFKDELLKHPEIWDVTASMEEPAGEVMDAFTYELEGMPEEDKNKTIYILTTDDNFNRFYENEILAGEDFLEEGNNETKYMINEAALKLLGYKNPHDIIGKRIKYNIPVPEQFFKEGIISGVINDFHITSMQSNEKPMLLYNQPFFNYCIGIKYNPTQVGEALATLEKVWTEVNPDFALQHHFIDDLYFELYENQIRQSRFLTLLAIVVLFISSLGLFSIAVYNIRKRTKEIGVRKVNGAKTGEVIILLNQTFIKWVAVSFVIAAPITWFAMNKWLENFAYKTTISWWIFAGAGVFVLVIALITVSLQSFKAARKNPVEALRYE